MRAMCTTKDRFNLQGNKLARALFRLAIPVEIEDEAWPSLYYSLGKRGVTEDNYLSIIEQGISCKGDIETFAAAQDLLEMKETGKSSALWGLDQVASLMRLIAAYFGDVRAYRDVGMDRIGLPWEGTPMVDVWHLICKDILLRDEDVSQYYDMDAATMKMARTIAKLIGTRHGFGAGPQTAAYGLLGLDRERDESRIDTYEGLDQILDKIEWPELYRHLADDDWTPDEHMALAKSKAELVIESIDSHYSWLSEDMGFIKNLMRNRIHCPRSLGLTGSKWIRSAGVDPSTRWIGSRQASMDNPLKVRCTVHRMIRYLTWVRCSSTLWRASRRSRLTSPSRMRCQRTLLVSLTTI